VPFTVFTPEELTALRRKERKAAKIERARLAVRAGQQLADGIVALGGELTEEEERAIEKAAESELKEEDKDESAYGKHIPGLIYLKPKEEEKVQAVEREGEIGGEMTVQAALGDDDDDFVDDMERLQLSGYETLFLAGMLGALEVVDEEVRMKMLGRDKTEAD
jgi:tRNA-splicing endonuclease subunit Sen2